MKNRPFLLWALLCFLLLSSVLVLHFRLFWLPPACFALGFLVRIVLRSSFLEAFAFLIPVLPAAASLQDRGFPLNYLLLPIFFLCGIMAGELAAGGRAGAPLQARLPRFYAFFLLLLGTSFFFVLLRWSNLTLSPLAVGQDTPVAPNGQRLSFAVVFPVVELALFSLSPLFYLLLKRQGNFRRVLCAFLGGQSLSIVVSFGQRLWAGRASAPAISGLASDATAFGFLSALAVLLAWYGYNRYGARKMWLAFACLAMAGIINSTTRIGLLALALAVVLFYWPKRRLAMPLLLAAAFASTVLLFSVLSPSGSGSSLLARLKANVQDVDKVMRLNQGEQVYSGDLAARRNVIWRYAGECLREFPLTGVGPGNFVFWVMARHSGDYLHHLTANQYLFFAASLGLSGLAAFLLFACGLFRGKAWPEKAMLAAFLLLFLFNDYLWFSEISLLFWMVAAWGDDERTSPPARKRAARVLCLVAVLAFASLNIVSFTRLHPQRWAQANQSNYDYGLSYAENEQGRQFQWTRAKAGVFISLDKDGRNENFQLACGAPLESLRGGQQRVDIYWRGRLLRRVVFRRHETYPVRIEDRRHRQGFLEFRVRPVFNLKRLGLGGETRTLGVQLFGGDIAAIQVAEPNGGEKWLPDVVQTVRWRSRGNIPTVKIDMSLDGGRRFATVAQSVANSGEYQWRPDRGPSRNCLIRVSAELCAVADANDRPFAMLAPPSRSGGSFAPARAWSDVPFAREGWQAGDFNGDGRADILKYAEGRSGGEVLLASGSRFLRAGSWTNAGNGSDGWYLGDFNGDRRCDLLRYLPDPPRSEVLLSTGGRFGEGGEWCAGGNGADGWYVGDFNGDGRSDLLRYLSDPPRSEVLLSTGTRFAAAGEWCTGDNGADGWYVGDFNGDGRSDLLRFVPGLTGAEVRLSDGAAFLPGKSWSGASPGASGWYVADFNGDGKSDLLRSGEWGPGVDVLLAGDGEFVPDGSWTRQESGAAGWEVADFNGDRRADLLRYRVTADGVRASDVLLATAAAAGRIPVPGFGAGGGRWLDDAPPDEAECGSEQERALIEALRARRRGRGALSFAEARWELLRATGSRVRRPLVRRLLKRASLQP